MYDPKPTDIRLITDDAEDLLIHGTPVKQLLIIGHHLKRKHPDKLETAYRLLREWMEGESDGKGI